jgi:hypothetical protein
MTPPSVEGADPPDYLQTRPTTVAREGLSLVRAGIARPSTERQAHSLLTAVLWEAMRRFRRERASTETSARTREQVAELLYIPSKGQRVKQTRCGTSRSGAVWYADQLQVLIKWDDGASSSLRRGSEELRAIEAEPTESRSAAFECAHRREPAPTAH